MRGIEARAARHTSSFDKIKMRELHDALSRDRAALGESVAVRVAGGSVHSFFKFWIVVALIPFCGAVIAVLVHRLRGDSKG